MRFELIHTLKTLGNPPPPFFVHEAFWWGHRKPVTETLRRSLETESAGQASRKLRRLLRDDRWKPTRA